MSERMTKDEAWEQIAWYATFSDAVDQIVNAHDALAALVDWPALLEAGERAGQVRRINRFGLSSGYAWVLVEDLCPACRSADGRCPNGPNGLPGCIA